MYNRIRLLLLNLTILIMLLLPFYFQRTVEARAEEETEETQKITYESGKWYKLLDTDLEWCFDRETKTLMIKGNGEIPGNQGCDDDTELPWWDFDDVQHIVLKEGITVIGPNAFSFIGCNITSVVLPESLKEVGDLAFEKARYLKNVKFPKNLKVIGCYAFGDCDLPIIKLPNCLKIIGDGAFEGCNVKKLVIPKTVEYLGSGAFSSCEKLTDIVLPEHIKFIRNWMFSNCISLKKITIPDSVTSIDFGVFSDCKSLKEIVLPKSVVYLGEDAFSGCTSLSYIELPMQLKVIHERCFLGCINLKNIVLPKKLTAIGLEAFRESGLTSIVIPANVTLLRCDIFRGCNEIKSIKVDSKKLKRVNKYAFRGIPESTTVVFPDSKKELYTSMFKEFPMHGSYINTKWWIDSNEKILYLEADGDMSENDEDENPWVVWESHIEKVVFGANITYIVPQTLLDLDDEKEVILSEKLERIGEYAFNTSAIKQLLVPENVTTIDDNAFDGCLKLKQIILKTGKLTNVSEGAWRGLGKGVQIIAPLSKKAEYEIMFEQTKLDPDVEVIYQ